MPDALKRIAAIAPILGEAELKVLLFLTAKAISATDATTQASSRELADACKLSRRNAQAAIDSLNGRGIVSSDGGSATRAASHTLHFLITVELEVRIERGVITAPPPQQKLWESPESGVAAAPGVASLQRQGGVITAPGVASQQRHPPTQNQQLPGAALRNAPARADRSIIDFEKNIDRLLKAKKSDYDEATHTMARDWIWGYQRKFGDPQSHPPDERIIAQFLAVAEWPRLEGMLYDLMAERRKPGQSYGWYVTVAIQRMWGLAPQLQRQARERLQLVKRAAAAAGPAPSQNASELRAAIANAAERKAMR